MRRNGIAANLHIRNLLKHLQKLQRSCRSAGHPSAQPTPPAQLQHAMCAPNKLTPCSSATDDPRTSFLAGQGSRLDSVQPPIQLRRCDVGLCTAGASKSSNQLQSNLLILGHMLESHCLTEHTWGGLPQVHKCLPPLRSLLQRLQTEQDLHQLESQGLRALSHY